MDTNSHLAGEPLRITLSSCTVEVETSPNQVVVAVAGELDMADAEQVGNVLTDATRAGAPIVRVDLAGLTFADSSAIQVILLGARSAEEHGATYELLNPNRRVQRLLQVTGLSSALNVVYEPDYVEGPNSL